MIPRIVVIYLILLAGNVLPAADEKADGGVLAVHGTWTSGAKTLKLGDPVKVNDKVRGTGAPGDRLTVTLLDGKPHEYTCESKPDCTSVIAKPNMIQAAPGVQKISSMGALGGPGSSISSSAASAKQPSEMTGSRQPK